METVIYEDSPLAAYLEGEGGEQVRSVPGHEEDEPASPASTSFAPRGKPTVRLRFQHKLPSPLRLAIPENTAAASAYNTCSRAVNSTLGRAENDSFLERFRYILIASHLLSSHSYLGQGSQGQSRDSSLLASTTPQLGTSTLVGTGLTGCFAYALVWIINWTRGSGTVLPGRARMVIFLGALVVMLTVAYAYVRRQWLQYLRQQTLAEATDFVLKSHEFDAAVASALTLVQEVELVSRGYRISAPLPPISRLEDHSQTRRCARLRKTVRLCFADIIPRYNLACITLKPLAEQMDLEKYYDIYDVSDMDLQEAMIGYSESEFEDLDALRVLKIHGARFHTIRKIFLCWLLALDAHGGKSDLTRWGTAMDEIHAVGIITGDAEAQLRRILVEEETFPVPPTPKIPMSPGRERWRVQLRKLNSLSTGIRGLQAKLHVLREESDQNLNEAEDIAELGSGLMIQYDSIGIDLRALMQEWEEGKAALASHIDKNERRISSMSTMLSPVSSLGGQTFVDDGSPEDALKVLNGEAGSRSSMDSSNSDAEEVFEAVALPRQRSIFTREERIAKIKEDRTKRESMKDRADASTRMLRELESVINLRPRPKQAQSRRNTSL